MNDPRYQFLCLVALCLSLLLGELRHSVLSDRTMKKLEKC